MNKQQKTLLLNLGFVAICGAIFLFLANAPPETTAPLPHDQNHERFMTMEKKEAEQFCGQCHDKGKVHPLPENHPSPYRCLFCHKRK